ncbi:MAG: VanZ family protein, partial [Clostridia bacterium]|nr:VanZ family protein [Clostridia bacterium]
MIDVNSLGTDLAVTACVLLMVAALPWADRKICERLGVNLHGGVSKNPGADRLLRLRQGLLLCLFGAYALAMAWLVLLSRSAAQEYRIHIALFEDLQNAVRIDLGFLAIIRMIFTDGFPAAVSHIQVIRAADIAQVYMNILLFVPMGYLLPYLFAWFREKARYRPVLVCFVISFLIENMQLIFRRGFYDVDDLVANVVGGFIGQWLFLSTAYVLTHPDWRKEMKDYRRWKRIAKGRTLYPFARKMGLVRTTVTALHE